MSNRLKKLPINVQKRVYEIAGLAGTICSDLNSDVNSAEYNQAMTAFLFATDEELQDFLYDHAIYNLEHRISWSEAMQEVYKTPRQKRVYSEYLRSPEWRRKRESVMQRAMRPCMLEFPTVEWKSICEREGCLNVAKHVHHWNYDRVGKEQIGMTSEESEENDLIALCSECHASLHGRKR